MWWKGSPSIPTAAEVVTKQAWESIGAKGFDERSYFSAFYDTLRWHCVTATDPRILQSPFRAGIRLDPYQLEPLRKALVLPRVNLFIADDVGLGKTIEAGLIASELLLRRRIDTIVVSCPPAMLGQWRDEMETRFGLGFEILDRFYLEKVRRQRGYGVNPWNTFPRFLVSQRLLIDEAYTAPLRDFLGSLKPGSLLILDEAHHAAPASGAKYAIDSRITRAIRDLAPRFEHRLFLSATPHNGHSNSFSALLELLDPQRFTRGVPVTKANLESVMVRRLKDDIREIAGGFPKRKVVQEDIDGLPEDAPELVLAELLDEYAAACEENLESATRRKQVEFKLVVSHLQQRLFSSIEAFARTLAVHRRSVEKAESASPASAPPPSPLRLLKKGIDRDDDLATAPEEEIEAALEGEVEAATASALGGLAANRDRRFALLERMRGIADDARHSPDARLLKLVEWMREHQCAGIGIPGKAPAKAGAEWTGDRLIIFTEYETTLRHIRDQLLSAVAGTARAGERIEIFYGATPTERREAIKTAFNSDPARHPVRILLATDAAREGLNLQAHCRHLFHFDVPWNPARLEQRNGRIDRKLQPADEVFCHYFRYVQRPEDRILSALVRKTETIKEELGSLSEVLDERLAKTLRGGLRRNTLGSLVREIEESVAGDEAGATVADELESTRERNEKLKEQIAVLARQLEASRRALHFDTGRLRSALSRSLQLAGFPGLETGTGDRFTFPVDPAAKNADPSWATTLDSLRRPPADGKKSWQWRREAPIRPVTFTPPDTIDEEVVQLHLGHRVARRLLSRFLAQGFVHHDLSRACFAQGEDKIPRVVLLGRLGLYGPGASRLHEEIVTVTARWVPPAERGAGLRPYARDAEAATIRILEGAMASRSGSVSGPGEAGAGGEPEPGVAGRLLSAMPGDIRQLLPYLEERRRRPPCRSRADRIRGDDPHSRRAAQPGAPRPQEHRQPVSVGTLHRGRGAQAGRIQYPLLEKVARRCRWRPLHRARTHQTILRSPHHPHRTGGHRLPLASMNIADCVPHLIRSSPFPPLFRKHMTELTLQSRLESLLALPTETEWLEFKYNKAEPKEIGEYLSALSNSAVLHDQPRAWMVWGVKDATHEVLGTTFKPRLAKVGNQDLEGWLTTKLFPRLDFRIHEFHYGADLPVVMIEIFPCWHTPVRFGDAEFIRVGSTKRRLKDYPEKERQLWKRFHQTPFEKALCREGLSGQSVLELIDYPGMFDLLGLPLPEGRSAILEKLAQEKVITVEGHDRFAISNLGAILFAKKLADFDTLARKAIRVIVYSGRNRVKTLREKVDLKGYANGFEGLIRYINEQLPANEVLEQAFRREFRMYPEVAVRELVANALIHQDFSVSGDGPKVEIFDDRVEFTNPGRPLIDTLRFVDEPPQSRNETLAGLMRRMNICEERGSGIDKTLFHIEVHQLPAPEFRVTEFHTVAIIFAAVPLDRMDKPNRVRACYLHACLKQVSNEAMTNESLRKRLNIPNKDYSKASRIIRETIDAKLVKPHDPTNRSRKHAKYRPFWA